MGTRGHQQDRPGQLAERLTAGEFAITAELGPPIDPDPESIRRAAEVFAGEVDAVNVTDNQAATVKVSALATAAILLEESVEPILQVTARDRNIMALQSDLLGAWTLGVRTVLTLSGDPVKIGAYAGLASEVRDVDSTGLANLITRMNAGSLAAGEPLAHPPAFTIVGAANPLLDSTERLEAKVAAGVTLFQTNIVYDLARFETWFEPIHARGITESARFLIGITPPRSTRMLEYLHGHIPGVEVDDATFGRMQGLTGDRAKAEGIEIAAELIERLRGIAGVAGVHLMAPGWETEAVPAVVTHASSTRESRR
jgi:methylenetetrahydrofolate reductase (NADPH)